jgi:hypothetical protein
VAIFPFQPGLSSSGHFDFLDASAASLQGGEVLVLDSVHSSIDRAAPDVEQNADGYRIGFRLANASDNNCPFFFADVNSSNSFPTPGFETTSLFATQQSFARSLDSSGKVAVYGSEGFYSIDVFASDVDESTALHTKLYINADGLLTAVESESGAVVAFFVAYRKAVQKRTFNKPLQPVAAHQTSDSILVYKTSKG